MYEQTPHNTPRGLILQQQLVSNSENIKHRHMKSNKPLLEKKRRARINKSLEQLKTLLMETIRNDTSAGYSKLEKADILEMAVKHLRQLHRQQQSGASSATDATMLVRYVSGFNECAHEVNRYLTSADGHLGPDLRHRLMNHLSDYISPSGKQQQQQQQQQQSHFGQRESYIIQQQAARPLSLSTLNLPPSSSSTMTSHADHASSRPFQRYTGPMTSSPRAGSMRSLSACDPGMTSFNSVQGDNKFLELPQEEDSRSMWCPIESLASHRSTFDQSRGLNQSGGFEDHSGKGDHSRGCSSHSSGSLSVSAKTFGTDNICALTEQSYNFQDTSVSRKRTSSGKMKCSSMSVLQSPKSEENNSNIENKSINNENIEDLSEMKDADVNDESVWRPW